ncbi:MAG: hypothetical protein LBS59_01495 [Puniceicoccales bacterium]|jgi:hypothetical protein|nr:hypothetical protein [Puniceicoccales bacterium]
MRVPILMFRAFRPALVFFAMVAVFLCAHVIGTAKPVVPATTPAAPQFDVGYIYTRWQEARDFKRISEYFTGREATGGNIVARSDATNRSGMYFRVGLPTDMHIPAHSVVTIDYVCSDSPQPRSHTFELPERTVFLFTELRLGLTGREWRDKETSLVAWCFTLRDNAGVVLARKQSFLWEMEDAVTPRSPAPVSLQTEKVSGTRGGAKK